MGAEIFSLWGRGESSRSALVGVPGCSSWGIGRGEASERQGWGEGDDGSVQKTLLADASKKAERSPEQST